MLNWAEWRNKISRLQRLQLKYQSTPPELFKHCAKTANEKKKKTAPQDKTLLKQMYHSDKEDSVKVYSVNL